MRLGGRLFDDGNNIETQDIERILTSFDYPQNSLNFAK